MVDGFEGEEEFASAVAEVFAADEGGVFDALTSYFSGADISASETFAAHSISECVPHVWFGAAT